MIAFVPVVDTAGQEFYDSLRPLAYPHANVVAICFSLADHSSLCNVETSWVREVLHYCPGVPFILVGLKSDLRNDSATVRWSGVVACRFFLKAVLGCSDRKAARDRRWRRFN